MQGTRRVVLLLVLATVAMAAVVAAAATGAPDVDVLETIGYDNLTATRTGEWLLLVVAPWSLASRQLLAEARTLVAAARAVRPALRVAKIDGDGEDRAVRHMLAVAAYPAVVYARAGAYAQYTDAAALRNGAGPALAAWLTALTAGGSSSSAAAAARASTRALDPFAPGERRHVRWLHLVSVVGTEGQHLLSVFSVKPLMLFSCVALALAAVVVLGLVFCSGPRAQQQAAAAAEQQQQHAVRFVAAGAVPALDAWDAGSSSDGSSSGTEDSEYDFVEYYVETPGSATPKKILVRRRKKKKRSHASKSRSRSKSHAASRSRSRK